MAGSTKAKKKKATERNKLTVAMIGKRGKNTRGGQESIPESKTPSADHVLLFNKNAFIFHSCGMFMVLWYDHVRSMRKTQLL